MPPNSVFLDMDAPHPDLDPAGYLVDFVDPVWIRIQPDPKSLDPAGIRIRPDPGFVLKCFPQ